MCVGHPEFKASLGGGALEEACYDRIRLGELVESELKGRRRRDCESILNRLRPLAEKR